jgi:hypothetical protein
VRPPVEGPHVVLRFSLDVRFDNVFREEAAGEQVVVVVAQVVEGRAVFYSFYLSADTPARDWGKASR